jgi:hypothetical protein
VIELNTDPHASHSFSRSALMIFAGASTLTLANSSSVLASKELWISKYERGDWLETDSKCNKFNNRTPAIKFAHTTRADYVSFGKFKCQLAPPYNGGFSVMDPGKCEASGFPREKIGTYDPIQSDAGVLRDHIKFTNLEGRTSFLKNCKAVH